MTNELDHAGTICKNVLCVQNHNVILTLNNYFAEYPIGILSKKDFMELQCLIWKKVKKELRIKL